MQFFVGMRYCLRHPDLLRELREIRFVDLLLHVFLIPLGHAVGALLFLQTLQKRLVFLTDLQGLLPSAGCVQTLHVAAFCSRVTRMETYSAGDTVSSF